MVSFGQQLVQKSSSISFYSNAPIEDVFAESKSCSSSINSVKKTFSFTINIGSFNFKNPLMEEHFNENYMESSKFPSASFNGNIIGDFFLLKEGTYKVFVEGELTVHGVTKTRKIPGKIIVHNGSVSLSSKFAIKLEEHGIKVPSIMTKKIAEIVEINVSINYKK